MYKPKFLIRLKAENFPQSEAVCLGTQLITIIEFIKENFEPHIWLAADVDAFSDLPEKFDLHQLHLKKIGNDSSFIKLCKGITQFLSGVFFAVEEIFENQEIQKIEVSTEDEAYRPVNLNGVLCEIRAFDTNFFEVYSENERFINALANQFKGEILKIT